MMPSLGRRIAAEWLGTAFLLAAVVGSGIMAQKLAGGNVALALLCNTIPTGAILVVLILVFGPVSGAHLNPAVSLAFALRRELPWPIAAVTSLAQIVGAIAGVWFAHLMFELPISQSSMTVRAGAGQWLSEAVATFGLLLTIFGCVARTRRCSLRGRPLHHIGLLVYGFDIVRKSGRDNRALAVGYVCGHCPIGRGRSDRGATRRHAIGCDCRQMAFGRRDASGNLRERSDHQCSPPQTPRSPLWPAI